MTGEMGASPGAVSASNGAALGLRQPISFAASANANDINVRMATEILEATDDIATRMIENIRVKRRESTIDSEDDVTNILAIRHEIKLAAVRIINQHSSYREERIGRVRQALQLELNVAAAFLLDLVDEPGRTCGGDRVALEDDRYRRRLAVYVSHIRRALRPRGLEAALITVRPRGYLISPEDAIRIRMLWGESLRWRRA